MTDSNLLKSYIVRNGIKYKDIAKALEISYQACWNKINNLVPFKTCEINTLKHLLDLTADETISVFFAEEVDKKSI